MTRFFSLLVLAALVAGCSKTGGPIAPREPGSVRFDIAADPATLNPLFSHQDAASVELQVARLAFEPFIDLDERGMPRPELLAFIPTRANRGVSADGKTLVYHLRPGVRWSDGEPVTSADVLFTLHAILDRRNPVRSLAGYELIDRASAPSANTVVFHLRKSWAPAVQTLFSYGTTSQFVLPKHILEKQLPLAQAAFNAAPTVGDGPFTFVSWQRGEKLAYVANPRYWRGLAKAKRLDIRIIPDPSTNLTLLSSGELDWNLIAPVQQRSLLRNSSIAYRTVPTATIAGVAINLTQPVLRDIRIRRALAMGIDRQGISTKITLGKYPVTDSAQPKFSWAYDASAHEPAYDPHKADAILDAAGWKRATNGIRRKDGKPLEFTYVQFPETTTGVHTATFIQNELRLRGIDLQIKSISNAQLFLPSAQGGTLASGAFDMAYVPWTMGADPDDSPLLTCHGASNYMRYCNPAVDRLEDAALASGDRAQRARLYSQIAKRVAADIPVLYLFEAQYIYAYRKSLHGFYPNAFLPTWNAAQWYVTPV
ncbi:MAG: peptide ABC transporter substrate-binding protein [Candidatus Eremiobacteraeota bacterium]|nr:peptide ABC transporter substrate-binding protein [Candidatus Eremiobacteraeota bacterium]